jgi:hypothetical protein
MSRERGFRAVQTVVDWDGKSDTLRLTAEVMAVLGVKKSAKVGFTPLGKWGAMPTVEAIEAATSTPKRRTKSVRAGTAKRTNKRIAR